MPLTEIRRYPVKSCRGESVAEAVVEPWGLAGDRRWMIVDADGAVVTAREVNRMLLVHPVETATGLHVTAPDTPPLDVARPDPGAQSPVSIWGYDLPAADAGPAADAWFSEVLGTAVRLVWLDDPTRRQVRQDFAEPDDRVSFADGFPVLVTTPESLAALQEQASAPVPMVRFRPNVVVDGFPAWAEDDWRRVRIGAAVFRAVKGCDRCVMTTVDAETAARGKEPIATLARTRRFDGRTFFGVNLVPEAPGGPSPTIRVGDDVEVLDAVAPGAGPLR